MVTKNEFFIDPDCTMTPQMTAAIAGKTSPDNTKETDHTTSYPALSNGISSAIITVVNRH